MTLKAAILLVLGGVLSNNYAFEKFLGTAPLLGYSKKDNKLLAVGLGVLAVILLSAPLAWTVQTWLLAPASLGFLQLLIFTALNLCVAYVVACLAKALFKKGIEKKETC